MENGLTIGLILLVVTALFETFVPNALAQPTAISFGVEDADGYKDTHVLIPVNITTVQNGPVPTIIFNILYNNSVINVTDVQKGTLTLDWTNPDFFYLDWGLRVVIYDLTGEYSIENGSTGSVVSLNFSVTGDSGDTSRMNFSDIQLSDLNGQVGTAPAKNGTFTSRPCVIYLEPQNSSAIYGHTVTTDIWVDACEFKSGEFTLTYNPTCANVTDYVPNTTNFPWSGWSHDEGMDKITFMTEQKTLIGNYKIGTLTIQCENETAECTTALNFVEPTALYDLDGFKIPTNWDGGSFTCAVICGDVNYDGKIDMGDVGALHNCVQYGDPISNTWIADVQCGNDINMGDVGLLHNYVQYGTPQLNCCPP